MNDAVEIPSDTFPAFNVGFFSTAAPIHFDPSSAADKTMNQPASRDAANTTDLIPIIEASLSIEHTSSAPPSTAATAATADDQKSMTAAEFHDPIDHAGWGRGCWCFYHWSE